MSDKILFVDDEQNILHSFQRQLRREFKVNTALGPEEGIKKIREEGPFAVVVSDFRMPVMNGVQFLTKVREIFPNTVRMMLTGFADVKITMEAVNEGNIFRFLTKPCPGEVLVKAIKAGLHQYHLITAEKELIEQTLKGSIKVLTEILALVNPEAFGRSARIKRIAKNIAKKMNLPDSWRIETAAMLSQIGCVILSEQTIKKINLNQQLTTDETKLFTKHPSIASDILTNIPRMKEVAEIIAYQDKSFDGSGMPQDNVKGKSIPVGARILKVALDFDLLETRGRSKEDTLRIMENHFGLYDPSILETLRTILFGSEFDERVHKVKIKDLRENMIFDEDVRTGSGMLLVSRGQEASFAMIERLKNFSQTSGIKEPILVLVPSLE